MDASVAKELLHIDGWLERSVKIAVAVLFVGSIGMLGACGADDAATPSQAPMASTSSTQASASTAAEKLPDVLEVKLTRTSGDTFTAAVTISSPYDSPQQYADGWRVLDEGGEMLGEHTLGHDHASEQPFTRTQNNLKIPADVKKVTVEGRDQQNGFGGKTVTVEVPRA